MQSLVRSSLEWTAYVGENQELTIEGTVQFIATPGDPGCRHTRNGDGWPPTPPEVEFYNPVITGMLLSIGDADVRLSPANLPDALKNKLAEECFALANNDELTEKALAEIE